MGLKLGAKFATWALLGRFVGVGHRAFIKHWPKMGSKKPSGSILGGCLKDLGKFGGGFGTSLGRILENSG